MIRYRYRRRNVPGWLAWTPGSGFAAGTSSGAGWVKARSRGASEGISRQPKKADCEAIQSISVEAVGGKVGQCRSEPGPPRACLDPDRVADHRGVFPGARAELAKLLADVKRAGFTEQLQGRRVLQLFAKKSVKSRLTVVGKRSITAAMKHQQPRLLVVAAWRLIDLGRSLGGLVSDWVGCPGQTWRPGREVWSTSRCVKPGRFHNKDIWDPRHATAF